MCYIKCPAYKSEQQAKKSDFKILAATAQAGNNNNRDKNNKEENQQQSRNASHTVYLHEMPKGASRERARERAGNSPRCWQTNRRTITKQINRQTGSNNNNNEICNHFGIIIHKNKLTKEVNIM